MVRSNVLRSSIMRFLWRLGRTGERWVGSSVVAASLHLLTEAGISFNYPG